MQILCTTREINFEKPHRRSPLLRRSAKTEKSFWAKRNRAWKFISHFSKTTPLVSNMKIVEKKNFFIDFPVATNQHRVTRNSMPLVCVCVVTWKRWLTRVSMEMPGSRRFHSAEFFQFSSHCRHFRLHHRLRPPRDFIASISLSSNLHIYDYFVILRNSVPGDFDNVDKKLPVENGRGSS